MVTGSAASLVSWEELGRAGRQFIASGPTAEDIAAFTGRPAKRPLRVYVGLNSADDIADRAQLLLDEMIRTGAFDRALLVVATPTGTGWMDPAAMDTLEYLHGGDTAIVGLQYSYLTSWISLLVEPGYGSDAARAMFRAVYDHWTKLPKDARPRLYLQGLSLGAHGSNQSFQLEEVIGDPFNGAVWSGPPFTTRRWLDATQNRNAGSPEWLPTFGDGSIIRFTNQENHLDIPGATWGPMRFVYLQYASDPITFFSPDSLWRKPDWMNDPVGPDVSPELRWYPVVTFLQLGLDMAVGLAVPRGFGHDYAPAALYRRLGVGDRARGLERAGHRSSQGAFRWVTADAAVRAQGEMDRGRARGLRGLRRSRGRGELARALSGLERPPHGAGGTVGKAAPLLPDRQAAGGGTVPDGAALFGLRRAEGQPRALGRDAGRTRLGGDHRRQPRAAGLLGPRDLAADLRRARCSWVRSGRATCWSRSTTPGGCASSIPTPSP